jgi:hypothetical protein
VIVVTEGRGASFWREGDGATGGWTEIANINM